MGAAYYQYASPGPTKQRAKKPVGLVSLFFQMPKSLSVDFRTNFLPCKEVRTRHNGLTQVSADATGRKICRKDAGMDLSYTP